MAAPFRVNEALTHSGLVVGSLGFDTSFQALDSKTDLLEACKVMGTMNVHRIPVLKDGKLCNFITQVIA